MVGFKLVATVKLFDEDVDEKHRGMNLLDEVCGILRGGKITNDKSNSITFICFK